MKKMKLAYKIIGFYLLNHITLVCGILLFSGAGIGLIQNQFLLRYQSNLEKNMQILDEEFLQINNIMSQVTQSQSVLTLRGRYEQLTQYERIRYKIQIREELIETVNQYRFIEDIGIYIPECNIWINVSEWFSDNPAPKKQEEKMKLEILGNDLYLRTGKQKEAGYMEVYVKFDKERIIKFQEGMKFDNESLTEIKIEDQLFVGDPDLDKNDYQVLQVESKLHPLKMIFYTKKNHLSFTKYFFVLGGISILLICSMTILFAKFLNKAIHLPLQNVVKHIDTMNEENFHNILLHEGVDEFKYVTLEFNKMKELLEDYIKKNYEQDLIMKQMELDHLQEQIKPHFLYNCFFNISNLCKTYDVDKVEKLSLALARYYRYITRTGSACVTLREEYEHMKNYLTVQRIRFEGRVDIQIGTLASAAENIMVSRLILQPIVENSYKYVFEHIEEGGELMISTMEEKDAVCINIEDGGIDITEEKIIEIQKASESAEGPITGLANLRKRLQYINPKNELIIERSLLGGLKSTVILRKENDRGGGAEQ